MEIEKRFQEQFGFALTSERLHFGRNIVVDSYGVSHDPLSKDNLKELSATLQNHDFVVVESDQQLLDNDSPSKWAGSNQDLIDLSATMGKPLICSDPVAETIGFQAVDLGMIALGVAGEIVLGSKTLQQGISRRQFLKLLGMAGILLPLRGSSAGEEMEALWHGFNGTANHPGLTDSFSYNEFRNSAEILGINQLIELSKINPTSHGIQFAGAFHLDDYRGYQSNGKIDLKKTASVYKDNIYSKYLNELDPSKPTIRVWLPNQFGQYYLQDRLKLNVYI